MPGKDAKWRKSSANFGVGRAYVLMKSLSEGRGPFFIGDSIMGNFRTQTKSVLRRLGRAPFFTAVTILTLGIGTGANPAIFSVLRGVLLKPLPYPDPDQLVGVWETAPGMNFPEVNASAATYFTFREENRAFEDIGLWRTDSVSVTGLAE